MILEISPDSSPLIHAAATSILVLHIGGGTVGIVSGMASLVTRKGSRPHRFTGNLFFVSILIMSAIGACVSPFLHDPGSSVAGALTFYLVATGWRTVRQRDLRPTAFDIGALLFVVAVIAASVTLGLRAESGPPGLPDDKPPGMLFAFAIIAAGCAAGDIVMILRRSASPAHRIARHLWRMTFALWIATGSLFLGQPQLFPEPLRQQVGLRAAPVLLVLIVMFYWLARVLLGSRKGKAA